MWSSARSEAALEAALPVPIEIRPMRNARRLRLRFDEASWTLRLTCPWRTSRKAALAWALDQRDWIEAQLARAEPGEPFAPGATIPFEGEEVRHRLGPGGAADAASSATARCALAVQAKASREGSNSFSRRRALDVMSREAAELCRGRGSDRPPVSVGDAGTRWGSCSSEGKIRLAGGSSWRRQTPGGSSSHMRSRTSCTSTTARSSRRWRRGSTAPALPKRRRSLRAVGPRLKRVGRRG